MKRLTIKTPDKSTPVINFNALTPALLRPAVTELQEDVVSFLNASESIDTTEYLETLNHFRERMARIEKPVEHLTKVIQNQELINFYKDIRSQHQTLRCSLLSHQRFSQLLFSSDSPLKSKLLARLKSVFSKEATSAGVHLSKSRRKTHNRLTQELTSLQSEFRARVTQASHRFPELHSTIKTSSYRNKRRAAWIERYTLNTLSKQDTRQIISREIAIRTDIARMNDYSSWAELQATKRAAGSADSIKCFLDKTGSHLLPAARERLTTVTDYAKQNGHSDSVLQPWDMEFWITRYVDDTILGSRDSTSCNAYFELDSVVKNIREIIHSLFCLESHEIRGLPVWQSDVRVLDWYDQSGEYLGRQYLDLHQRPGTKSIGAWKSSIYHGSVNNRVSYYPVCSLQTNFPSRCTSEPVLLSLDMVRTLFHEFGHCLHELCCRLPFSCLGGTQVARDILEYPSSFLELFSSNPHVIQRIGTHWQTGEAISATLVQRLLAAENFKKPLNYLRRLHLGMFDFHLHNGISSDINEIHQLYRETSLRYALAEIPEHVWPETSFNHIFAGDYDVGYYGYLYAMLYAQDAYGLFTRSTDPVSSVSGQKFKEWILSTGNAAPMSALHHRFKGEPLNPGAYFTSLQ